MNTPGGNSERVIRGIYPNMTIEDLIDAQVVDSSDQGKYEGTATKSTTEKVQAVLAILAMQQLHATRFYQ